MISAIPLLGAFLDKALDFIPNPNEKAKRRAELETMLLSAANEAALAQTRINEKEAQHGSIFVAGWRPFIGWVCGSGLAWSFVGHPIFAWAVVLTGSSITPPEVQTEAMISLVMAMLGMAGWRSLDKMKGVARTKVRGKS